MGIPQQDQHAGPLAWIDLEMTGLDPDVDDILEIAVVVTDRELNVIAEAPELVLACPEERLAAMDDWNTHTHGGSGLLDAVRASTLGYAEAEARVLEFLRTHVDPGRSPMCGNTICQDRRFLYRRMRRVHDHFHYRNFDVSSFKLAALYWQEGPVRMAAKDSRHRALSDILGSIDEMRHYRATLLA